MNQKTIVITGSTRGIGLGLAREFVKRGHQVVVNGRNEKNVSQVVSELHETKPDIIGVTGSISDEQTHLDLIEKSVSAFGKIDIWINNAGIPQPYELFADLDPECIRKLVYTNIYGLLLGTRIAAAHMTSQGYGKIFNMEGFGSDGRMMNKLTLYGTTKRAVHYFTKAFAREMKDSPVQIGVLSPGMVRTDFISDPMKSASPEESKRFKKVHDILAEEVDVVAPFLVRRMLESSKNYDRIEFLTKTKIFFKMMKMLVK